jgi:hypothetical protein
VLKVSQQPNAVHLREVEAHEANRQDHSERGHQPIATGAIDSLK